MGYFPLFINLTGKRCIVIGDGRVAQRKAESLRLFDGDVTVCAKGEWDEQTLEEAFLVVAATDCRETNRKIASFCTRRNIPVNVADAREESTFLFPAVIRQGPVSVGISTGGSSPLISADIRRKVEEALPQQIGRTAEYMEEIRTRVTGLEADGALKKEIFRTLYEEALNKNGRLGEEETAAIISKLMGEHI